MFRPQYLSTVVEAVLGQQVVDLGVLHGAEHQGLPVVLGVVVEVPEPHPGEVHVVGLQRLQVHVPHSVLWRRTGHTWVNSHSEHAKKHQ